MGRTLHNLTKHIVLLLLLFISAPASAVCISPLITPTECDFKNEDTQLWFNQPAHYHQREHNIDSLVGKTKKTLTDYVASIKTTGDAHIVPYLAATENVINAAVIQNAAAMGITLANDPFHLKTLYLDISRCIPFWEVVMDEHCPTTFDLLLQADRLVELRELQNVVDQIRANPFRVLGEQWGDIGQDINEIKAEFNRGQTLARNLGSAAKGFELDTRFPGYQEFMARPRMNYGQLESERMALSTTVRDTLIDTLKAARRSSKGQRLEDQAEMSNLNAMGRNAIGTMQEIEISNMHKINAAGVWAKITEQQMNLGNLIGVEMADELYTINRLESEDERSFEIDPLNPTVLGNEPAPFLR